MERGARDGQTGLLTKAAACDGVNLRTGPSTGYAIKTNIKTGMTITVVATVSGGSWSTPCAGKTVSRSTWYRISAVNGRSVASTYGVTYLYGATGLFTAVAIVASAPPSPTPSPTATASPTPTATPTPSPSPTPTPTPTATPTPKTLAAACDGVNLRTGSSTGYAIKASVPAGTTITVAATVSGGSWSTPCAGKTVSGAPGIGSARSTAEALRRPMASAISTPRPGCSRRSRHRYLLPPGLVPRSSSSSGRSAT